MRSLSGELRSKEAVGCKQTNHEDKAHIYRNLKLVSILSIMGDKPEKETRAQKLKRETTPRLVSLVCLHHPHDGVPIWSMEGRFWLTQSVVTPHGILKGLVRARKVEKYDISSTPLIRAVACLTREAIEQHRAQFHPETPYLHYIYHDIPNGILPLVEWTVDGLEIVDHYTAGKHDVELGLESAEPVEYIPADPTLPDFIL